VVAVGAFLFVGGGSEEDGAQTPAVQTAETQTKAVETPAPVKKEAPVTKPAEPAAEPVAEQAPTPAPAAEPVKEAPKQTMAQKAASAAAQAPAAGPQADVLTQGLEAYKNGNYKEAHDLFKRAATAGNPEACYQLGLMLSTGKGTIAKNPLQGKVWIKKAAGLGHEEAKKALETL
jgi:TPR repeat protein